MTPRVLILVDSLTVRKELEASLGEAGFATTGCRTPAEAWEALAAEPHALVILASQLEGTDGLEMLSALKAAPATRELPVMLLSSEPNIDTLIGGMAAGADDYITLPYDPRFLALRIRELLRARGQQPPTPAGQTVLVVDDSLTFREEARRLLEAHGYRPLLAATGEEGLRLALAGRPQGIIVDGQLPGIDGPTVIRRLRTDAALRGVPTLLLTGADEANDELVALEAGADAYVRKDTAPELIMARLAALLRSASAPPPDGTGSSPLALKRLLAIDAAPETLQGMSEALATEGYDLVWARSGEEAMAILSVLKPDAILLGHGGPGSPWDTLCQRLKETPALRDVPLIILKEAGDQAGMIAALQAGADDVVARDGSAEVLKGRLRAHLRRRHVEDEQRRVREERLQKELEQAEARAARELAQTRAALLADLEAKNMALEWARDRAEAATRAKSEFLANMSHELRTPLNAILGFTELVLTDETLALDPVNQSNLEAVMRNGKHLLALINDVLDLAKIEAGRATLRLESFCPRQLAEAVVETVAPLANKRGLSLGLTADPDLPEVVSDEGKVRQILLNLASNAVKFTPEGSIRIALERRGAERWAITVSDTGVGIRPEDQALIFEKFQQADNSTTRQAGGTGLGLAISRELAELLGGSLDLVSIPGEGSTFTLELPISLEAYGRAPSGKEGT